MDHIADVFNDDAFSAASLSKAILQVPYQPMRIEKLGLFSEQGIDSTKVFVEIEDGKISLLPTKPRGGEPTQFLSDKRRVIFFEAPHIPYDAVVTPEEVQNIRKFGEANVLQSASDLVTKKLAKMVRNHNITHEYHRIGAIQGQVRDADGTTVIHNLFNLFDITEETVDFDLDIATTDVLAKCLQVKGKIEDQLGAEVYTRIHAFCGTAFFAALVSHPKVQDAFMFYQANRLSEDNRYTGFIFGGITFEEYRGKVSGQDFVAPDTARFFPVGVDDLFATDHAPANSIDVANQLGQKYFASQERRKHGAAIDIHTESNPLIICTRPGVLIKGVRT